MKSFFPRAGAEADRIAHSDRPLLAPQLLWEQRRPVTILVLHGAILFLLIAFLIPNSYEAKTELMPLAALCIGGGDLKSSGALFVSILNSDTVRNQLINRFDLRRVYSVNNYRRARQELGKYTEIHEDRRSGLITITVTDHDRERVSAMARAYVEELNRTISDLNTSDVHRERVFLEERIEVVKQELERSASSFSEFSSKNIAIDIEEQGRIAIKAAGLLESQVIATELELRGLEQIYGPHNVRISSVQARGVELRRQLAKMGGSASGGSSDSEDSERFYPSIRRLPVLGVTSADLFRRVKIKETILEVLTEAYERAKIEEAKELPSVHVFDDAESPERRSGPPRVLITLAGALLSFCFATFWLFVKDCRSPQFRPALKTMTSPRARESDLL